MIVADTSGLLALFNRREPAHERAAEIVGDGDVPIVVSPFVLAELDYLVATRFGVPAELTMLEEIASGAYELAAFDRGDIEQAASVIDRYGDQEIGLADASIVVLAHRYSTKSLLTLDHRHFDVVRPIGGGRFRVLL
jgi:predicted nucleic acid-binding protein